MHKVKVGWDITHQEFTITDYYYFSILQKEAKKAGIEIEEVEEWRKLKEYDTIVFNYPEIPFREKEVKDVERWVKEGKNIILLGYYKNEDHLADICNTLARNFGMELNPDEVTDEVNNYNEDKYFVVTSKIIKYNKDVKKIVLPCTASIKPIISNIEPVVKAEDDYTLLIAEWKNPLSKGSFCLAGTCVFWDNYSISLYDNLNFSLNLLKHR